MKGISNYEKNFKKWINSITSHFDSSKHRHVCLWTITYKRNCCQREEISDLNSQYQLLQSEYQELQQAGD